MTTTHSSTILGIGLLLTAACGGGDKEAAETQAAQGRPAAAEQGSKATEPGATAAAAESPPSAAPEAQAQPVTREVEGLVSNTVRWISVLVTPKAVRLVADKRPEIEVELAVQNDGDRDWKLPYGTWDLVLGDGTRLRPRHAERDRVAPGDTQPVSVFYQGDSVELDGAALELNGTRRGKHVPQRIPLGVAYESPYPIALDALKGKRASPAEDGAEVEITDAFIDVDDPTFSKRASADKRFLRLAFIATAKGRGGGTVGKGFAVVVDGHTYECERATIPRVRSGLSEKGNALCEIESTVKELKLAVHPTRDAPPTLHDVTMPTLPE